MRKKIQIAICIHMYASHNLDKKMKVKIVMDHVYGITIYLI